MKKQTFPILVFVVLVLAIAVVFYMGGQKKIFNLPDKPKVPVPSPTSVDWPLPPNTPGITATYVHYYFSGKIKDIEKTDSGGEIKLEVASEKIPAVIVDEQTRISRISLPYSLRNIRPIKFDNLAVGMTVDISIEFDLSSKKWIVRDVYVPDDRN